MVAGERASGGTQGLRSWRGHGLGPPYGLYPPPLPSVEGADSSPIFYFWKFTGCGISAQSHWCCVLDFFLCFQIFFKQSIFLGAITQKGPVGCVRVS